MFFSVFPARAVAEADAEALSRLGASENDSSSTSPAGAAVPSQEKRLVDWLMRDYDADVRPVKNSSEPVIIRLGITLTQIFDLVSAQIDTEQVAMSYVPAAAQ
ncbi:hypothetical protein HPB48_019372 [Haemaphysalis longicornis]|uniref:Neurotransmitter-gated ion-channel ligand-binding domain-containing protein n=1 Tax=Haemaphysalis longicornis TaxID=44386 RepID=A0A9J6G659_HAELO|nr:hypothetical protein HPB48_019372 [Haemaphysalis longicornis]